VAPILDPSVTYAFSDTEAFARASAEKVGSGYVYTRWANPTIDAFETAAASLEGAEGAEAFATGMAAISSTFLGLCKSGDTIVAARQLYGGSYALLAHILSRYGIATEFVDVDDHDAMAKALQNAVLLYCETIGNPRITVADLDVIGRLAGEAGVPLVVDNTFASPVLCRPLEHGATLVVHSATKFLGGHHDLMGGVVCGPEEVLDVIRVTARETGPTMAPFNAWLALRGLATMHLRVDRSCESALEIARALERHPGIGFVDYPALDSSPDKLLCDTLLGGRGGGTMGFDVAAGKEAAVRFQDALRLIKPAASLGGVCSLIVHAASVTHTQLSTDELASVGITPGFCRLSVGVEDVGDLKADLAQALEAVA
jgi:cystathionine beta-lyase/cystathionine gamma-synthase